MWHSAALALLNDVLCVNSILVPAPSISPSSTKNIFSPLLSWPLCEGAEDILMRGPRDVSVDHA